MSKQFKAITLVVTFVLVVVATMFGVMAAKVASTLPVGTTIAIEGLDEENEHLGMINFLVLGVDKDEARSDTIMLFSYDGYSNRVNALSFPRDTKVLLDGYYQKLNAAMGVGIQNVKSGKDKEPEEELIRQIKQMTGLPIHYFMTVDLDGFIDIIDALGGIDFNVPYNMSYDDPVQGLHIHLKAGMQHLDGQAAHDFVRFRHNNDGSAPGEYVMGDEGRIHWQQEFMKELFRQKVNAQLFNDIDDIFEVIADNVRTNYTMQDLMKHLSTIKTINLKDVGSYQLPGAASYEDGVWWYIQDPAATSELVEEIFRPRSTEQWEQEQAQRRAQETAATPTATAAAE